MKTVEAGYIDDHDQLFFTIKTKNCLANAVIEKQFSV